MKKQKDKNRTLIKRGDNLKGEKVSIFGPDIG